MFFVCAQGKKIENIIGFHDLLVIEEEFEILGFGVVAQENESTAFLHFGSLSRV